MNFTNEEKLQNNNMGIRSLNFNNNMKVPRRKQKLRSEKSNPEIVEFKSQDNLIFLKNSQPIQNVEPYLKKDRNKEQKQLYDSNNRNTNSNNDYNLPQQSNKSNSSVKINTKVNCKKYFASNNNAKENHSNKTYYKEKINQNNNNINNNVLSNNPNIIQGKNTVKINGTKKINYYNNINSNQNINNNKNNHLTMTKSSIQISGNYPLNQSQNIYNNQSKIESMELNIEGKNSSKGKYNNNDNFFNNKEKSIHNKFTSNQNYKNKTHLVKREPINRNMNYNTNSFNNSDNLKTKIEKENIIYSSNIMENVKNKNMKIYNNYNANNLYGNYNKLKNNLINSANVESDKNILFGKNSNEYNNIFFYNSNKNTNDINENFSYNEGKNNFQYREDNILNDDLELNEYINDNNNYIKNKSNEISTNNKFIYKKSGNLSEKKLVKIHSTKYTSHLRANNDNQNNEQNLIQRINKDNSKIKEKNAKIYKNEKTSLKDKRSNEIKINRDINSYYNIEKKENKNGIKKEKNKNIIIKKTEIKNKIKNSYDIIDFKFKIPLNEKLDEEELMSINIKEGNIKEKIGSLINKYSLDSSYFDPLLSLINNSINILNNINDFKIAQKIKIDTENNNFFFKKMEENFDYFSSSKNEKNILDYSIIFDLLEKKAYKEYIENIYSDIDEINENAKILNLSI